MFEQGMSIGWGMMGWGWIIPLSIFVIVFYLIFMRSSHESKQAKELLKERFARGEIDEEEYRRKLSVLEEKDPS